MSSGGPISTIPISSLPDSGSNGEVFYFTLTINRVLTFELSVRIN